MKDDDRGDFSFRPTEPAELSAEPPRIPAGEARELTSRRDLQEFLLLVLRQRAEVGV